MYRNCCTVLATRGGLDERQGLKVFLAFASRSVVGYRGLFSLEKDGRAATLTVDFI
jgi:hypothetical protein